LAAIGEAARLPPFPPVPPAPLVPPELPVGPPRLIAVKSRKLVSVLLGGGVKLAICWVPKSPPGPGLAGGVGPPVPGPETNAGIAGNPGNVG
jgi:hypothetical protein